MYFFKNFIFYFTDRRSYNSAVALRIGKCRVILYYFNT